MVGFSREDYSIRDTVLAAVVLSVAYVLGLCIYRLFFHPLAKFPGPKSLAVSRWPEFYHDVVLVGQFIHHVRHLHKQYGPIVRISPDEIHIEDPDFFDTLYAKSGRLEKYKWETARFGIPLSVFSTEAAELHRIRRAVLNPFFSRKRIVDFQPTIRTKVDKLVSKIQEYQQLGKVLPIGRGYEAVAGDIILEYCFAIDGGQLDVPGFTETYGPAFMAGGQAGLLSVQFPIVPKILRALPEWVLIKLQPVFAQQFEFQRSIRQQILDMKEGRNEAYKTASNPTIFGHLLTSEAPPEEKSTDRLQQEGNAMLAGGVLTMSTAMTWATFYITENPKIFARLRKELEEAIPDPNAPLEWAQLEQLPYLTAIIKEAIRMSYAVTGRLTRLALIPLQYKEWTIPSKTPVSMNIVDVHENEEIFPQPNEFLPERWLGSPKAGDGSPLERYFVGFSKGTRNCIGMNLAWAELYIALAAVFRRFEFELYETDRSDVTVAHDFFISSVKLDSKGVNVKVKPSV